MKRKSLAILIILSLMLLISCAGNQEPVKGVESSKFEIGDIEKETEEKTKDDHAAVGLCYLATQIAPCVHI